MGCSGSGDGTTPHPDPTATPRKDPQAEPAAAFKAEKACPVEVPEGVSAGCGKLQVPEDYSKPDGRKIELQVAIFESSATAPR